MEIAPIAFLLASNPLSSIPGPVWVTPVVVLVFLVLLVVIARLLRREPKPIYPYEKMAVLSEAELHLLEALAGTIPDGTFLLTKVRLADFLRVKRGTDERMAHFGRISQKHTDFLIVDAETSEPLLAIELDDSTHRTNRRTQDSDAFKDAAYAEAGLPILRIRAAQQYDSRAIAQSIRTMLRAAN